MSIGLVLKREIESTFTVVSAKSTEHELVFVCPECGDVSGNRSVNLKTGKTFCWRCNKGKNNKGFFLAWARALGYRFEAGESLSGVPVEELLYTPAVESTNVPVLQEIELPVGYVPIARTPKSIYTRLITEMAERKNLGYDDMAEAAVGYTMDDARWERFAIFPIQEYGMNVYYQGRTYVDVPGESTKLFPSRNLIKWGASYWIYNLDTVRKEKPEIVVIVESILNVLSLRRKFRELGWRGIVPVCVFKHHMSQIQVIKLLRCTGIKEFCLLFDHDAIDATWRMVGALNEKVAVTVAEMPMLAGNRKCDPNDDVEAAITAIESRSLYTTATASDHLLKGAQGMAKRDCDITGISLR